MKVEVNFDYWDTLYQYFDKDEFKLNGDIIHDARIIERIKYLYQNASKKYLKINVESLVQIWTNIDEIVKITTYKDAYEMFISYLFYATDRMNPNRWLFLQMCINRASNFIYDNYSKTYKNDNWFDEICDGFYEGREYYFYNIEKSCAKEWKDLIKQTQKKEMRIKNKK